MSNVSESIKKQRGYSNNSLKKQAQRGKTFDAKDRARYDQLAGRSATNREQVADNAPQSGGTPSTQATPARVGAKERAQTYNASTTKDVGNTPQQVTQDNDQTSSVTGDNNYVYQNQDNSVRNYGGDTRVFNYQGSGNPTLDTPASAATMAGFYAPDDSHAAIAGRVSRNQTLNADAQKKYANTSYIAEGAIKRAANNAYIDPAALDKRIGDRAQYSRSKATVMNSNLFGDMAAMNLPDWQRPEPQKETETPDFDEMYKKYTDF